jgi:hypothetical protein
MNINVNTFQSLIIFCRTSEVDQSTFLAPVASEVFPETHFFPKCIFSEDWIIYLCFRKFYFLNTSSGGSQIRSAARIFYLPS